MEAIKYSPAVRGCAVVPYHIGAFAMLLEMMMDDVQFATREEWLSAAVEEFRAVFEAEGFPIAQRIRVSCGFPSNARRSGAIGECWADTASADKTMEILISPAIAETQKVVETLVHELCHTTAGAMNHGVAFRKVADALGLLPSATKGYKATYGGDAFKQRFTPMIEGLGGYPHAELSLTTRKKQATRMLKAVCPSCGYTVRLTAKWAYQPDGRSPNLPCCPNHQFTRFNLA